MQFFLVLVVGVFCVIFGLYEKLLNSFLHFFRDIKKNTIFLLPIIAGALTGIFLLSNILQIAFDNFYIITSYIFMGLILGSVPLVVKQSKTHKITLTHIMCLVLSLSFSLYLIVLENGSIKLLSSFSIYYLILAGFLMSAGIVIPGISKTAILMMMGVYSSYLSAISTLNFSILIPMGIGLILGGIVFMLIINFLFCYLKSYTYFLILGFVIGSVFVIYPGFEFSFQYLVGILLAIFCFLGTYKFGKLEMVNGNGEL